MNAFKPWKILNIDLGKGLPSLQIDEGYQGLYIVFWWYSIPLGHREIPSAQLPITSEQLANLALRTITPVVCDRLLKQGLKGHSAELYQNSRIMNSGQRGLMMLDQSLSQVHEYLSRPVDESVSVIICTRDRSEQLAKCLRSLQDLSQYPEEILVVDNAPRSDSTRQLVAKMPRIRYILEPRPGLDVARNTGIRKSTGDIVAFIDDDVMVHPNWITRLLQGFNDPKVMAVTGLVLPMELETEAQFIFEKYWGFNRGYRALTFDSRFFEDHRTWGVPVWRIGAGANMAFRRTVFELVGGFDERLDVGAAGCSGDSELWYRMIAGGWTCVYEPAAVVYHNHRRDTDSLERQVYYYMRGHVAALLIQFEKYRHFGNLLRLFIALPAFYVKSFLTGTLKGFGQRRSTLLVEISGYVSGIKFYLKNRSYTDGSKVRDIMGIGS